MEIKGYEYENKKCINCNSNEPTKEIRFKKQSIFLCTECRKTLQILLEINNRHDN